MKLLIWLSFCFSISYSLKTITHGIYIFRNSITSSNTFYRVKRLALYAEYLHHNKSSFSILDTNNGLLKRTTNYGSDYMFLNTFCQTYYSHAFINNSDYLESTPIFELTIKASFIYINPISKIVYTWLNGYPIMYWSLENLLYFENEFNSLYILNYLEILSNIKDYQDQINPFENKFNAYFMISYQILNESLSLKLKVKEDSFPNFDLTDLESTKTNLYTLKSCHDYTQEIVIQNVTHFLFHDSKLTVNRQDEFYVYDFEIF